jgi:sugar lactone lactonase YvrE
MQCIGSLPSQEKSDRDAMVDPSSRPFPRLLAYLFPIWPKPIIPMNASPKTALQSSGRIALFLAIGAVALASAAQAQSNYATPYTFATLAGSVGKAGLVDGAGSGALFSKPTGLAVDGGGNLYVADSTNYAVRKVTPAGMVTTIMDQQTIGAAVNLGIFLFVPKGVAVDGSGNVYVSGANVILKLSSTGVISLLAGSPQFLNGFADGPLAQAQFNSPLGLAVDGSGNLYVADGGNHAVRKISPSLGVVSTLAGDPPQFGFADGTGSAARFEQPTGVALDSSGNVFVTDSGGAFTVRKVTPGGVVTTIAGTAGAIGFADGTGGAAQFNALNGIAIDSAGNLYVTDDTNTIRKVTAAGVVTTLAGTSGSTGSTDGTGASALFSGPNGIAVDATGDLFVADSFNDTIRVRYATTRTAPPSSGADRLYEISTRANVGSGANIEIAGFAVGGPAGGTEQVLIRGIGPTLAQYSVTGELSATVLSVFDAAGNQIATNTGWGTSSNTAQIAAATTTAAAFALPSGSQDSVLLLNLAPGNYTAQVSGQGGATGIALAEIYEVSSSGTHLANISTRALVGTGTSVEIPGIVIRGSQPASVLIRAAGPALTNFSVSGVLAQPTMSVIDASGNPVASNTGWSTNGNAAAISAAASSVGAFAFTSGSADCALVLTLQPGTYTVVVSGVGGTSGVALVEAYLLP